MVDVVQRPLSSQSEVVDEKRRWTQDWYTWLSDLSALINTIQTNIGSSTSGLDARVTTLEGQVATLQGQVATNTTNIATNTANIATNTANIATNTANIATNTSNIATNTSAIAALNSRAERYFAATITAVALGINITAVDTTNDFVTVTSHGLVTGQSVVLTGTVPAGLTTGTGYYVRALSANTLAFYLTLVDANADTNRVNITGSATGGSMRYFSYTNVISFGFDSVAPVGATPGTTTMSPDYNLSSAVGTAFFLETIAFDLFNTTPSQAHTGWEMGNTPTRISSTLLQHQNPSNYGFFSPSSNLANGTWGQQGTSSWVIQATVRG